jgi:hypothetical protein
VIRIVTAGRIARLEKEAEQAHDRGRDMQAQANAAWGRHMRELYALTGRLERAEATTSEAGALLARAMEELSAAQQELLLKDIEIRRLRQELEGGTASRTRSTPAVRTPTPTPPRTAFLPAPRGCPPVNGRRRRPRGASRRSSTTPPATGSAGRPCPLRSR